jgi:gluconate 2-dehydrogenase gamma chain
MTVFTRRAMLAASATLFGMELAAPLAKALAAEMAPGFSASHAVFTAEQRSQVAAISERIVPTTDTPGAIAAGVPGFIEMMISDWYVDADRDEFMNGLGLVEGYCWVQYEKPFVDLSSEQQDMVLTLAMQGRLVGLGSDFFGHCRQLAVLGYYTSEIGCKQERVYLPVPGHYDGKYPYADVRRVFSS